MLEPPRTVKAMPLMRLTREAAKYKAVPIGIKNRAGQTGIENKLDADSPVSKASNDAITEKDAIKATTTNTTTSINTSLNVLTYGATDSLRRFTSMSSCLTLA